MFDFLLTEEEKALQNEVREFVKNDVPSKLVRDMDLSIIETGRPFIELAAKKNQYPSKESMRLVHKSKI